MKNHELLDLIGDVNEDYVLEAGNDVVKPRFGWKKLAACAACAACAALVLGAYPVYRAVNPLLHGYTVMEGGGTLNTLDELKAPAGEINAPDQQDVYAPDPSTMPGGAYVGREDSGGINGAGYDVPSQEAPVQEKAAAQYDSLMKNGGINPAGANPDWYGGAWIDNSYYPEAKLAVAIVDDFRTPELEAQIQEWCGGEVVFQDVKYDLAHLYALQDTVVDAITGGSDALSCGIGVDVTANCLGVDIYSNGKDIPREVLAKLAQLDPDGDAIRVRVFTGELDTLTDESVKGPAPDVPAADPVAPEDRATPVEDGDLDAYAPAPSGAVKPGSHAPGAIQEGAQPAVYDLPQSKYTAIAERD